MDLLINIMAFICLALGTGVIIWISCSFNGRTVSLGYNVYTRKRYGHDKTISKEA